MKLLSHLFFTGIASAYPRFRLEIIFYFIIKLIFVNSVKRLIGMRQRIDFILTTY